VNPAAFSERNPSVEERKMKKMVTGGIVAALICCVCVIAQGKTEPETTKATTTSASSASTDGKRNEKLRADVQRLVSDAKAGKLKVPAQQFPAPTHRNNLSKGAKIAIIGGIAGAIIFVILWYTTGPGSD
jgi:hypothetical protein